MRGLFITLEGVEGAGKSTQAILLRDALSAEGYTVFTTREPGGNAVAEAIRTILLDPANPVVDRAELLLFLAARAQLVVETVRPRLAAGEVVICDRYEDSTIAYQGYARGLDLELVRRLNEFATGGLSSDVTFVLDVDPACGLSRQKDHNRMEAESLAFHQRVREGFLRIAAQESGRIHVLDGTCSPDDIHAAILGIVRPLALEES